MTTQETIATGVRIRLAHINKSQAWLAAQVGFSKQAVTSRMVGRKSFDSDDIDRFATALGLQPQNLTSGELIPSIGTDLAAA